MSIVVSGISYHYLNQSVLFESVSFSVHQGEKVSIIGHNGIGKSTLLKLLKGELVPSSGSVRLSPLPYYIPQQINIGEQTVAESLGVKEKIAALNAICRGSSDQKYYNMLNDDWDIETRCHVALEYWDLQNLDLETSFSELSGGEKEKVLLAGLTLHHPDIVLLDEPTNHLDSSSREKLYGYVSSSKSLMVIVSHDVRLLNLVNRTYELSTDGIKLYGGNYDFYREQKRVEEIALEQQIHAERTTLRIAQERAREVRERQMRRASQGERDKKKGGDSRIVMNARRNLAENSSEKLKEKQSNIVHGVKQHLSKLLDQQKKNVELKLDVDASRQRMGKSLITVEHLNFGYPANAFLWKTPIDLEVRSGDRVHIIGNNGSGKTTFVRLLLGELKPTEGKIVKSHFSYAYLDQECSRLNRPGTVLELAEQYNAGHLPDHEVKLRLNRALFPKETWDKCCRDLSGGERMRLYLCCLMISNSAPDMFILDEPTNNLDLSSLSILIHTIENYRGTVLAISHDDYFINRIGITKSIELTCQ
ncbi:MAG: ATP-binding cassette domain-containing protein [Prevotella sp.]|jgi:ATPase subunit of ABC transporter with duplicated ATPase domains|nr:ABC-F family ATP-binding cassette domain-containing protein [Prevotella sp.]MCH3995739.1 ATP-binding cassette domain-containing protein [Prevotella sp.]